MIQRSWRNRITWLRRMVQSNPVLESGGVANAIDVNAKRQEEELKEIRQKILIYESNKCVAEKLTDTI